MRRRTRGPVEVGDVSDVRPAGSSDAGSRPATRVAGLKGFQTPTLEGIQRRRGELLALSLVVLIGFAVGMVLLSFMDEPPEWFTTFGGTLNAVRVGLLLLVVGFAAYLIDNERRLFQLSKFLVNEQVLSAALANRLKEISLLSEAGKAVSSTLELDDVLHIILNAAFELLAADEGSIMLVEGDELVVAAAVGHPHLFVGDRRPIDEGLAGYVARTRERLLVDGEVDLERLPRVMRAEGRIHSAMLVPMQARSELLGVLNLDVTTGSKRYTEYELRALHLFAEHAAMAIRHARALSRERDLRIHAVELDRVRTELVGTMAHDLKSPLTSILGAAKVLLQRSDEIDEDKRREFLESVERQSQKLLTLIERLLEAARSHVSRLPLSPGPLDLVPQVEALAESYASAYGRRVVVESHEPKVIAYADPDAVEQVLGNLLENAVRHTPSEGAIFVDLATHDGCVALTVRDEGPGIPEDLRQSIFVPFRRAHSVPGSGLGLFVVSNLVKAMGGDISVVSPPGQGAAFTFTLPTQASDAEPEVR